MAANYSFSARNSAGWEGFERGKGEGEYWHGYFNTGGNASNF